MKYEYVFFDLDGTLLETLNDILTAVNTTLDSFNYPVHFEYEAGKRLLGNGARKLVERALESLNLSDDKIDEFLKAYLPNYLKFQGTTTEPFSGVVDTLNKLHKDGVKLFIVTNKPQPMTDDIVRRLLPDVFVEVIGQSEKYKIKPDPEVINVMCDKYNINKNKILFVGDSLPDLEFAKNGKVDSVLCTYGYAEYNKELLNKANYVIDTFDKLISIIY